MAILAKCLTCKREGGYAKSKDSKICARCMNKKLAPKEPEKKEEKIPGYNS